MRAPLCVLVVIGFFIIAAPQQTRYRKTPPKPSELARGDGKCAKKHRLYVSAVDGVPAGSIRGSAMVSCQFITVDCTGNPTKHASEPAPGEQDICLKNGWIGARNAIDDAAIETCCEPPGDTGGSSDPEPDCPPATSWFDDSAECKERRELWAAVRGNEVVVTICGYEVFRHAASDPDRLFVESYRQYVASEIRGGTGRTICCDKFREAVKTGRPCDPSKDLDCDGIPNQTDTRTVGGEVVPVVNSFTRSSGARIDPFPPGLNAEDPDFLPHRTARNSKDVGDCPCKWELIKGELKCGRGGQGHVYLATWRCPTTKAEVITARTAPASAPCDKQ